MWKLILVACISFWLGVGFAWERPIYILVPVHTEKHWPPWPHKVNPDHVG